MGIFRQLTEESLLDAVEPYGQTIERGSILLLEDSAFNLLKEFWPDVHQYLRHKKLKELEAEGFHLWAFGIIVQTTR